MPVRHSCHLHVVEGLCTDNRKLLILLRTGCAADTDCSDNLAFPFEWNAALQRREILKIAAQRDHRGTPSLDRVFKNLCGFLKER